MSLSEDVLAMLGGQKIYKDVPSRINIPKAIRRLKTLDDLIWECFYRNDSIGWLFFGEMGRNFYPFFECEGWHHEAHL